MGPHTSATRLLYEGEVDPFARELAEAVIEEAEELDREITESADDWSADRLGALERNILRIGVHELAGDDVPVEVAINEAVELASATRPTMQRDS